MGVVNHRPSHPVVALQFVIIQTADPVVLLRLRLVQFQDAWREVDRLLGLAGGRVGQGLGTIGC